ncbi:KRI1-like family C-terminal-domain-containing protein [Lenzites betulinus]|nr:KRI1-like family C-terminal-domain-containing protein [Lenzites betulinus]
MFSDDSDVEDNHTLTVNEHYAKAFEYRKEREELAKLKEKYGSDFDEEAEEDEDSEEGVTEDEDGEELTPAVDAAILRTLARIKRKDPAIYETGKDIFEEEKERTREAKLSKRSAKDKSKPLTLRQHAIASALDDAASRSPSPQPLTHFEEQEKLRSETIAAFHASVPVKDEEEEEDFLVPREKTKDEIEREAEEYRAYLQREVGEDLSGLVTIDEDVAGVLNGDDDTDNDRPKKKAKKEKKEKQSGKSKQEADQEFLMNYILDRGWIDKTAQRLPTYKEITSSRKGKGKAEAGSDSEGSGSESDGAGSHPSLEEDDFDEVAERFESSYNFRFEEPGAAQISRYPRTLPDLVRRQDTARKETREKKKARKEEELLKKKEEVKRLKALKLKELRAKLERIGQEGGKRFEDTEALQELDLEGEWDPSKHDEQMAKIYGNDEVAEDDFDANEKPQWDDDIDIGEIPIPDDDDFYADADADGASKKKKKKKKKKKGAEDEDEGGVDIDDMDATVERAPADDDEEWDGTEEMRRRKLEEYMDEVYGLDFNDMVAGMPTRFKYAKVESQNFGLTPAEILMATDAELNSYMGVKKIAPYRKEGKGRNWDSRRTERLQELKSKLKERGVGGSTQASIAAQEKKKRKGKKERMRSKVTAGGEDGDAEQAQDEPVEEVAGAGAPTKRGHKRGSEEAEEPHEGGETSGKKRRRKHKKSTAAAAA